ncbi:MAG TPA: hypothetical protein VFQ53_20230 [Kofleriaceae bacterium]|nr:hypothetical protein [Kofleriaceae bacterium]
MRALFVLACFVLAGCPGPTHYQKTTQEWTRKTNLRGAYQEVLQLAAVFKSPEWRAAYAEKDADARGLTGAARQQRIAQAQAEAAGPIEIELLVTTWDRRENDLDHGKRSVWRVRMIDDAGTEIEPLEIVKDKRPAFVLRAEFPDYGDFATAYVARFPRPTQAASDLRIRLSSERGGVQVEWPIR